MVLANTIPYGIFLSNPPSEELLCFGMGDAAVQTSVRFKHVHSKYVAARQAFVRGSRVAAAEVVVAVRVPAVCSSVGIHTVLIQLNWT